MSVNGCNLNLPQEVNTAEAAKILGVSRRTVIRYIEDGLLLARDVAPMRSKQKNYRMPLEAVVEMRTGYVVQHRHKSEPKQQRRTRQYEPQTMKRK